MKYRSVFDIIGPVMVGPSSSHTAGPVRIGQIARRLFDAQPEKIVVRLYGSFAETYKGHASDVAVVGGILNYETDDPRIPDSLVRAKELGIDVSFIKEKAIPEHPNTMEITLLRGDDQIDIAAISIGGGVVRITKLNGFPLKLSGENPAILIFHKDAYGAIAGVASTLAANKINISGMDVSRIEKGDIALMTIETDQPVSDNLINAITKKENIIRVITLSE
ncbi:L-serine ammonia-lyase, iron-sulfur-dependent subunit beta [Gudongella sp. DL1XJH-153]|uniref:L-serine ammonia-lyase, iron-sulfur-dependent subunit beta n=1 Tax=Gudongella sp. DL1XJH-153 TaxID=3409804 RepID=UPI003BB489B1